MINYFGLIIQLVCLVTLVCIGVYMNRERGDIFYVLTWATNSWPDFLRKPIIGCVNCMASFWGTIVQVVYYWLIGFTPTTKEAIIIWAFVTISTAGLNGFVWVTYRYFDIACKLNPDV